MASYVFIHAYVTLARSVAYSELSSVWRTLFLATFLHDVVRFYAWRGTVGELAQFEEQEP